MEPFTTYRYFWIKVTDDPGRTAAATAEYEFLKGLAAERAHAEPGTDEWKRLDDLLEVARSCLGPGIEYGTYHMQYSHGRRRLALDIVNTAPAAVNGKGVDIVVAAMPPGYNRLESEQWLESPLGKVWAHGALACRLQHAVATDVALQDDPPTA